jgi:radical SAM protein with 4Fe4S-binding SPASM domain
MLATLFTNGTMLTPRLADLLGEYPPHLVEITLYGATQATYERVTGVQGSYARCMRGIDLLLDRGLRLNLKSVVLRANQHEMEEMRAIAERLDVPFRFDGVLWPRLDGGQEALRQRLSPAEVVALDREYPERQQEYADLARKFSSDPVRAERVYACGAGQHSFHVDCAGRLSVCMMTRQPAYDLLSGSFQEGWEGALAAELSKTRSLDTPCRTCTANSLCAQCPGWSRAVHGDDETPVEYICEIGRLRAAQAIPDIMAHSG